MNNTVPKRGSKKYNAVLALGCGGYYDAWNGDYDCKHEYSWLCDDCPIVDDKYRQEQEVDHEEEKNDGGTFEPKKLDK